MPLKIRTKPSNPKYREGYDEINWHRDRTRIRDLLRDKPPYTREELENFRCTHPETDTCTGPAGDPRIGKEICVECGEPIQKEA